MRKTKKALAILALVAMVLTMIPMQLFAADDRLSGNDRYETAIAIAEAGWANGADTVILAAGNNENLVDALAAASLAGQEKAPILLTPKASLNSKVAAAIKDLGAKKVYIIGAAQGLKAEVQALGVDVVVLAGDSRWDTASKINAELKNVKGTFVVAYDGVADALSVASFAAANGYQIVLAKADGTVSSSELKGDVYTVGGKVKSISSEKGRFAGADRFATNEEVVKGLDFDFDVVYVANGLTLADALAAAPFAAKDNAPVLLASASDVKAASYVNEQLSADSKVVALGGTSAVPNSVLAKVAYEATGVETVAVTAANYDDDTEGQYVAFTVNGKKGDVAALAADGWDIVFTAYSDKAGSIEVTGFFADQSTGLISVPATVGDYYIQVVLTKDADVVASALQKISIKNLNVSVSSIDSYELENDNAGGTAFTQESTTLIVGEKVTVKNVTTVVGSNKVRVTSGYTLKTSNEAVISVDNTASPVTFEAKNPGNATVTIVVGKATKDINFKVVADDREIKKVRVKQGSNVITSLKVVRTIPTTIKVEALDQFGDPFVAVNSVDSSNTSVIAASDLIWSAPNLTITARAAGSSTLNFYDANSKKIGSLAVTVSGSTSVAKKAFELWAPANNTEASSVAIGAVKSDFSTDATVDLADDKYVVYHVMQYNADNLKLGAVAGSNLTVSITDSSIVSAVPQSDGKVLITGLKTGSATVQIKDNTAGGKTYTQKITVVDTSYTVKSVSFKSVAAPQYATTYTYKSVLNYTSTANDPILNGVTLNKATAYELRLDPSDGTIYIDTDADGDFTGSDVKVGEFQIVDVDGSVQTNVGTGVSVTAGDEGTVVFRVVDNNGKVVSWTSVKVDL